ncbi:MAG TPA: DM13 domain-containing protein [Candidatus Limnocylindrales bacterium]|nr:DM13 domain-containing protein [Candidatus Limnocylindrales bacterium]
MEWIGDLERAVAATIYPNRVVIGAATLVAVAAVGLFAWRHGWFGRVRRHPGRSTLLAALTIAIIGPIGWYLGSPLILSTTVDEPPPVVAAEATSTPTVSDPPATPLPRPRATSTPSPRSTPTPTPSPAPLALRGAFSGADEFHFGRGTARLIETAPGAFVVRLEEFAVRNGPDLYVYLSPDARGYADGAIELGRLKADNGNQNYEAPAGLDPTRAASIVIWCKQFSVQFAVAPLASDG